MNLQRREEIRAMMNRLESTEWVEAGEYKEAMGELLAHIDTLEQTAAERVIASGSRGPTPDYTGEGSAWVPPVEARETKDPWESSKLDYDRSIHSNRDAKAWADFFVATYPGLADKRDIMLGWFANAMMAMHDSLKQASAVVVPDDTFTLDLDEFGKKLACITISSKNRGVGYELCGTLGDGHFSRRTFDITPYLAHCLNTIGVRAIPADRVPGEGMVGVKWIPVDEALPEDGQTVGFVTECSNDRWYHGRVLGGRYMAGEFGGFSVPGLMVQASHWFAFPPLPDALRANQGGA